MTRKLLAIVVSVLTLAMLPRQAMAYTITVNSTAQTAQRGEGCTITEAILLVGFNASWTVPPGLPLGVPVLGNCTVEIGGEGLTILVPAGTYMLTAPYANIDGQAGFPMIGPDSYPFIGVPWGVRIDGDPAGGTVIMRDPSAPAFRLFWVQTWLELRHLTLAGGDAGTNRGGAIFGDDSQVSECPPGVVPPCRLPIVLRDVTFENNTAGFGGALSSNFRVYGTGFAFTIEDSTFRGNHADYGGAIGVSGSGAATVRRSRFEDNDAAQGGGAIVSDGGPIEVEDTQFLRNRALNQDGGAVKAPNLQLTRVTMRDNTANNLGGAVQGFSDEGLATIIDSTFAGNSAQRGGAVSVMGQILVTGSTFTTNLAYPRDGGAIFLDDRTNASRIANSTFSANRAYVEGTAISLISGGLTLVNDTITGNTTSGNWGPAVRGYGNTTLWVSNSIIAGNTTINGHPLDILVDPDQAPAKALVSLGSNLIGTDESTNGVFVQPGDQVGTTASPLDPGLLSLADNGGPTLADYGGPTYTHALAPGSLALDAGSVLPPGTDDACEIVDQRGTPRPVGARCDIGAFEATEPVQQYQLDLSWNSGGTITDGNGAPLCPSSPCSWTYDEGTVVTLVAQPELLSAFTGWSGDCAGAPATCVVTMNQSRQVSAAFAVEALPTTMVADPASSGVGDPVTLRARIQRTFDGVGLADKTVTFRLESTLEILGTATSDPSGLAVLTATIALPAGNYVFVASFDGEEGLLQSSATNSLTFVAPPAPLVTTTTVRSSTNPSASGQAVTFTATVEAVAAGAGTPTGEVSFVYVPTSTTLATVEVVGGIAVFQTSELPEGTFDVQAIFTGDGSFAGSASALTQVVAPAASTPIRNGSLESRAQFNGVGTIRSTAGEQSCTATLVSPLVALTTAQCVRNRPAESLEFSLGPDRTARVTGIRAHPLSDSEDGFNLTFDFALVSLDRAVAASWTDIVPATLRADVPRVGVEATAVGFGETSAGAGSAGRSSGALIVNDYIPGEGPTGVVHSQAFLEAMPGNANQMFCPAGTGGPLFYEDQIVGLAAFRFVETCAEPGAGYYVTTSRLADWIRTGALDLEADPRELTVEVEHGGLVYGLSSGACEGQCSETYIQGTVVELTAGLQNYDVLFTQWVGCDYTYLTTCWVTMNAARTVVAEFEPVMHGLTVQVIGQGVVTRDPAGDSYPQGTTVTLTAQPDRGFRFSSWGAGCSSMSGVTCTVQMGGDRSISAYFIDPRRSPTARITQQPPGVIEATGQLTSVTLSGATSSDRDSGGPLTFLWTIDSQSGIGTGETFTPTLSLGVHVVTLVVTDADGLTGHTTRTITVRDRKAPVLVFPSGLTISASALSIPLPPNTVTAVDLVYGSQPVLCTPELLWLGTNTVQCETTDPLGNRSSGTFRVMVVFPALTEQAGLLLTATQQASGATLAMLNLANRLVNGIANGNENGVCPNVVRYDDAVQAALSRQRITSATADGLVALLGGISSLAACVP